MIKHNDLEVTWLKEKSGVFLIYLGWKNTLRRYYLLKRLSGGQSSEFKVQEKKLPLIMVMSKLRWMKAAGTVGLSKTTLGKMPSFHVLRLHSVFSKGCHCLPRVPGALVWLQILTPANSVTLIKGRGHSNTHFSNL